MYTFSAVDATMSSVSDTRTFTASVLMPLIFCRLTRSVVRVNTASLPSVTGPLPAIVIAAPRRVTSTWSDHSPSPYAFIARTRMGASLYRTLMRLKSSF